MQRAGARGYVECGVVGRAASSMLAAAVDKRSGSPLAVVDLGLPRNVDVAAHGLANVFVNDLQALQILVDGNLAAASALSPMLKY